MSNSLVTSIVGVGEKSLPARLQGITINDKSVVLRSNVAFPSLMIQHRLILTTISKRKLLTLSSGSKAHELITHTNTINRLDFIFWACDDLLEFLDGRHAHGWITRTVRQEQTVVLVHFGCKWIIPWHHSQFNPTLDQLTNDIVLHSTIDSNNLGSIPLSIDLDILGRNLIDQVLGVGVDHVGKIRCRGIQVYFDTTQESSLFSNLLG